MSTKSIYTREYKILLRMLKSKRQQKRFSQLDIAKKLHVPQSFISKIESGERRIDVLELFRFCQALGINAARFIGELTSALQLHQKGRNS